jgi:hypothetical protein
MQIPGQAVVDGCLPVGARDIPDGTLCDEFNLHRGYWEAKDTDDNLDDEISRKSAKGYARPSSAPCS